MIWSHHGSYHRYHVTWITLYWRIVKEQYWNKIQHELHYRWAQFSRQRHVPSLHSAHGGTHSWAPLVTEDMEEITGTQLVLHAVSNKNKNGNFSRERELALRVEGRHEEHYVHGPEKEGKEGVPGSHSDPKHFRCCFWMLPLWSNDRSGIYINSQTNNGQRWDEWLKDDECKTLIINVVLLCQRFMHLSKPHPKVTRDGIRSFVVYLITDLSGQ